MMKRRSEDNGARTTETADLPVGEIAESPFAAQARRRAGYGAEARDELVASIRAHGVLQPILVRVVDGRHELVAGERRLRAAREAGLETVPCVVASGMDDAAAIEAQLVENLQREALDPLVESAAYDALLAGRTVHDIARTVGRSVSHVRGRLKLRRLNPAGEAALAAGALDATTALMVARLPRLADQDAAVERLTKEDWQGKRPSHREARRIVADQWMRRVDSPPWGEDRDGMLTPAVWPGDRAPRCADCPHRTGATSDYPDSDPWLCTKIECYDAKVVWAIDDMERREVTAGREIVSAKDVFPNDEWHPEPEWVGADELIHLARGGPLRVREVVPADQLLSCVRVFGRGLVVRVVARWSVARAEIVALGGGRVYSHPKGSVPGKLNPDEASKRVSARRRDAAAKRRALHEAFRPVAGAACGADLTLPITLVRRVLSAYARLTTLPDGLWRGDTADTAPCSSLAPMCEDVAADGEGVFDLMAPPSVGRCLRERCEDAGIDVKRVEREAKAAI